MDDELKLDVYSPEYGKGIGDCFRAIYGEGYAVKTVYDPLALQREFELGNLYFAVALNKRGTMAGCEAVYRSSPPFKSIYEFGAGVVLPQYRGRGIQYLLFDILFDYLKKNTDAEEIFGESVCNHTKIQKMMFDKGSIETALEVDLVPAGTFRKEGISTGRVATLLQFISIADRPQKIFVPQPYGDAFNMLYSDSGRERNLLHDYIARPPDVETKGDVVIFEYASVARLMINVIGKDIETYMLNHDLELKNSNIETSQVFLPLNSESVNGAVKSLRSLGYFLGGILPRWFDCDGILMQKTYSPPNWSEIRLYTARAEKILGYIKTDWKEVSGE
jgi:GNAT superfamily N-acetyltransferase